MARKPEQLVWDALKRAHNDPKLRYRVKKPRIQRIENVAEPGTPDTFMFLPGGVFIELKVARLPKRPATPIFKPDAFEQEQLRWARNAVDAGIIEYCVARDNEHNWFLIPAADIPASLEVPWAEAHRRWRYASAKTILIDLDNRHQ